LEAIIAKMMLATNVLWGGTFRILVLGLLDAQFGLPGARDLQKVPTEAAPFQRVP